MDKVNYSSYVIGANTVINTNKGCRKRIYFDNGATTLIFKAIEEKINSLYPEYTYIELPNYNSAKITEMYNESREIVKEYLGADKERDISIDVKNATDGINIFANAIFQEDPNQIVLTTKMEHLANYLPYKEKLRTELIEVTPQGNIDLEDYKEKLELYKGKVKYVCVTAASNVTGIITPFYEMARLAHEYGARIFVDIVQLLQHRKFSMKPYNSPEHIDFVAFSAHKCYAGLDGGALIGPSEFFDKYKPLEFGASITKFVNSKSVIYDDSPGKYEAGYPDVLGTICMGTALKTINSIGINRICSIEKQLYWYLLKELKTIPNIKIYGIDSRAVGIPFISFNIKNIPSGKIAEILGYDYGIELAGGKFGADIYVQTLLGFTDEEAYRQYSSGKKYGVVRVSLGFYNTFNEIDELINALKYIVDSYSN